MARSDLHLHSPNPPLQQEKGIKQHYPQTLIEITTLSALIQDSCAVQTHTEWARPFIQTPLTHNPRASTQLVVLDMILQQSSLFQLYQRDALGFFTQSLSLAIVFSYTFFKRFHKTLVITKAVCAARDPLLSIPSFLPRVLPREDAGVYLQPFLLADVTPLRSALLQVQGESGGKNLHNEMPSTEDGKAQATDI